jgi:DUF1680 family protein
MLDMCFHAGNKQALEVASGMAAWTDDWSVSKPEAHMQGILQVELGGMSEALYNLAAATNDDRRARVGERFNQGGVPNPARAAPGRTAKAPREHARSAGDRRGPTLRVGRRSVS